MLLDSFIEEDNLLVFTFYFFFSQVAYDLHSVENLVGSGGFIQVVEVLTFNLEPNVLGVAVESGNNLPYLALQSDIKLRIVRLKLGGIDLFDGLLLSI